MATRILGLDIGSRFVRGVVLERQGRSIRLAQLIEEPIERPDALGETPEDAPPASTHEAPSAEDASQSADAAQNAESRAESGADNDEDADTEEVSEDTEPVFVDPIDERAWDDATRETVARILQRPDFEIDWLITAAPEGAFMFTQIELPFKADREVRAVLGPQLDDRLPGEDIDLHLDYMVAGPAQEENQWRLYAGGIDQREMAQVMAQWQSIQADPRIMDVMPFPLLTAGEWLAPSKEGTHAYIDIGAHYTRIVVSHGGDVEMVRTIPGGGEAVFEAIADTFDLTLEQARVYTPEESILPEDQVDTEDGADPHPRLTDALQRGLRATLRDLRRTLAAHAAQSENGVEAIYVSGAAFDLPALQEFVPRALGVPVHMLRFDREEVNTIPNARGVSHRFTMALGLALRAHPPEAQSHFNLRNGNWAFRGAYAYIQQRLPSLLLLAGVFFFCLLFFLIARNALFKAEYRAADDGLAKISEQVFGVEVRDPDLVKTRLARGVDGLGLHPDISAFDVVVRISQAAQKTVDERMPIELDNIDADMGRRQVRISGVCDSANAAETFGRKLGEDNCLQSIQRNNLSQRRSDSKFEFSYTASVSCRTPDPDEEPEIETSDDEDGDADDADNDDSDTTDADSEETQ